MPEYTVTSEIYIEQDYKTNRIPFIAENVISQFPFLLPKTNNVAKYDEDQDLDIERPTKEFITVEHAPCTELRLVGLQVWRGSLLLGDLLLWLGVRGDLSGRRLLELGAGTGLTSFIAAIFAHSVVCTDIGAGGILDLIKLNVKNNSQYIRSEFKVCRLDFTDTEWDAELRQDIERSDIVLAADVVYDDDITEALVATLQKILSTRPPKTVYVALEKRYVFTLEALESVAPCYETFLSLLHKVEADWTVEQVRLDFPQYFRYNRVKELVLWKISS